MYEQKENKSSIKPASDQVGHKNKPVVLQDERTEKIIQSKALPQVHKNNNGSSRIVGQKKNRQLIQKMGLNTNAWGKGLPTKSQINAEGKAWGETVEQQDRMRQQDRQERHLNALGRRNADLTKADKAIVKANQKSRATGSSYTKDSRLDETDCVNLGLRIRWKGSIAGVVVAALKRSKMTIPAGLQHLE